MNEGDQLALVNLEILVLDAFGKPLYPKTWKMAIRRDIGQNRWMQSIEDGRPITDFYRSLPPWASTKLHALTGFLHDNPGEPPVPFQKTDHEVVVNVFTNTLTLAPGILRPAALAVAEKLIKKVSIEALKKAVVAGDIRFGAGADLNHPRIDRFEEQYRKKGEAFWQALGR